MNNHDYSVVPIMGNNVMLSFMHAFLFLILFSVVLCMPSNLASQNFCHTPAVIQGNSKESQNAEKSSGTPCRIRIYVHVLTHGNGSGGQSEQDIWEALSYLDAAFNPHGIFFEWDGCIDPIPNTEIYETDSKTVMNVLYTINGNGNGVDLYFAHDGHLVVGGRAGLVEEEAALWIGGSYTFPSTGSIAKSYVLAHEMGHLLGLDHTHASCEYVDNWEKTDGSNKYTHGDKVHDTPADPSIRDHVDENCVWDQVFCIRESVQGGEDCGNCRVDNFPPESASDYTPDTKNIMSYTIPTCMEYFTDGQADKMLRDIPNLPLITPTLVESSVWSCDCEILDMHIHSNTVFDDNVGINGNIFVHAPATLTITSTIQFGESKHIIVERGAKLHVDGGTLTKCPEAADWGGIRVEGNSAEDQPSASGPPVAGKAGIIYMTNNAHVEHARTAMSTSRWQQQWNSAFWGGMIYCENTTFLNNGRVAEILKYDKLNSIRFVNCTMDGSNTGYAGTTIWDTDGVTFNRCRFYNMSSQGISATDAGVIVKDGNDFIGNNRGIVSRASFPFAAKMEIGEDGVDPNYFINNTVHIESEATNKLDGLEVINNEFFESNAAFRLNGPSKYKLRHNAIDETTVGINSFSTGALQNNQHNFIEYNTVFGTFGINVLGENRELQFICNDFSTSFFDFRLKDRSGVIGEIRNKQGNSAEAAGNCFTNPGQVIDVFTSGTTTSFDYYATGNTICAIPQTAGNYNISQAAEEGCLDGFGGGEHPTEEDYILVKDEIAVILNNGGQPADQLADLLEEKEHILLSLLEDYIQADNINDAIGLLDTENTVSAQLMKYGVQVDAGLYQDAQITLNGLPNSVPEMATFKQVQVINLDRLQQGLQYQLSESDRLFLETTATSDMGIKSYARSVLYLLTGQEYFDVFTMEDGGAGIESMGGNQPTVFQQNIEAFYIFPNPTKDKFTVWIPKNSDAKSLRVTTILGQNIYEQAIPDYVRSIELGQGWEEGIYIVQVIGEDQKVKQAEKVFIQK